MHSGQVALLNQAVGKKERREKEEKDTGKVGQRVVREKEEEGRESSMIAEVSDRDKVIYLRKKAAFLVFSHLHYSFRLKTATPFLALQIFSSLHCHPDLQYNPPSYLHCVSIYLAMKYHQIYPPSLRSITEARDWTIDKVVYKRLEQKALTVLGANVNMETLWDELSGEMGECGEETEMMGRFMLEVSLVTPVVWYSCERENVIQAIVVLCRGKSTEHLSPKLLSLCKMLLKARQNLPHSCLFVYQKYTKQQYLSVSLHPLPHLQSQTDPIEPPTFTDQ